MRLTTRTLKEVGKFIISCTILVFAVVGVMSLLQQPEPPPAHTDSCYAIHFDDELSVFKNIEVIVIGKDEDGQETLWRYTAGRE